MTDINTDNRRAWRNVGVLVLAQALIGSQMPMIFVVAGLAGQSMASNICWATLPVSLIVFGSMTTAPWMSQVMQRFGRRAGFMVGTLGGAIAAAISAYALTQSSFPLFLLGSYFTGIYMSAHGFYRFAAIDTASEEFRPKAMSYVMAGGLAAAIFGTQMTKITSDAMVVPFLATYILVIAINFAGPLLFMFLDIPTPEKPASDAPKGRSRWQMLKTPRIAVAIICAMVSYALMNLIMTSTPLAVVGCGYTQNNAADVVMGHVLAMFVPSFFTGHLISRFGAERIVAIGLTILAAAGLVGLAGIELTNFFVALIFLGIGWNFGFIGATTMLAGAHTDEERGRIQGINDMMVFGFVTIASVASGTLMNCSGNQTVRTVETVTHGWNAVNYAMVPFLILASVALIWLVKNHPMTAKSSG